jgi:hypothetical protein
MNTKSPFKSIRESAYRQVPSTVLLAALAACGGGGGGGGSEPTASRDTSSANMVRPADPGSSGSFIPVVLDPSNTPAPAPSRPSDPGSAQAPAPTPAPAPASAPAPAPAPAPAAFSCAAGAITCVEVSTPLGSGTQASLPVTFGQPFKSGDWLHTAHSLVAKVDGATIPLQSDEISSHRDGSARFAVLSAQLNDVQAGQVRIINLFAGPKTSSTANLPSDPNWNLELEAQLYDANGNPTSVLVAQPQAQLKNQISSGSGRRLAGPVASEFTVVTSFKDKSTGVVHPHLTARLHARLVDGGNRIRTDVVMENTRTFTPGPGNITYSMDIKRAGALLYSQPKFTHYHHARWHKVVWSGAGSAPRNNIRHHMPYFMSTRAVWNYNLNLVVPKNVLEEEAANLAAKRLEQSSLGPMANVFLNPYFPATGGRPEIGPLPRWTALYFLTQDARALDSMLANADAAAAVPIHYRDEATDRAVNLINYPNLTTYFNQNSQPFLPYTTDTTIWSPDSAHQGSYTYVPYLITGDAFYLDEMTFWANYNVMSMPTSYRDYEMATFNRQQVRGAAWSMRAAAEAAWSLPDAHDQKAYYQRILQNNLEWYDANHATVIATSPLGFIPHNSRENEVTGPWQNDFVSIVFSLLVENGETKLSRTLNWFSRFSVGRFVNDANGFCSARGAGYYWTIKAAPTDTVYIDTWSKLFAKNYPNEVGVDCKTMVATEGYPDLPAGSAAFARAMLAATTNAGVANARTGYERWKLLTPLMDKEYPKEPTWAIIPR